MNIRLSEIINAPENKDRYVHFSIDDISSSLKDINVNYLAYLSIFDNALFRDIKRLHTKYNASFTLYLFGISGCLDISDFTSRFDAELLENSDWLQFGYHGVDDSFNKEESLFQVGYEKFIKRFKEMPQIQTDTLRIHRWSLPLISMCKIKETGVKCLLTADSNTESYNLTKEQTDELCVRDIYYDGILYKKTDLRIERIILQTYKWLPKFQKQTLIIFTHEYKWNANKVEAVFKWLCNKNYSFVL